MFWRGGFFPGGLGGYREVPASQLASEFSRHTEAAVYAEPEAGKAFRKALELKGDSMLFCAGSLYLAGEIKKALREQGDLRKA